MSVLLFSQSIQVVEKSVVEPIHLELRAALDVVFTKLVDVVRVSRAGNCVWCGGIVVCEHLVVGGGDTSKPHMVYIIIRN